MKSCVLVALPVASCFQVPIQSGHKLQRGAINLKKRPLSGIKSVQSASSPSPLGMTLETAESMIDHFFQSQPYLSAFLTCSVKASAADVLAQVRGTQTVEDAEETEALDGCSVVASDSLVQEKTSNTDLDWQRTAAFLFYGGLYQGLFQEFLYAGLFPKWFPSTDWQSVVLQVGLDMAFFSVFLCLPIAYIVKTAFMSDEQIGMQTIEQALHKYLTDVKERGLLFKYWGIWIPVQTLNFSVVPTHFRVAFVAVVSFFWMFILSSTSAQGEAQEASKSLTAEE